MKKPTYESTKEYYDKYQGTPKAIHERSMRNKARREYEKKGLVEKGDGKEIDHKHPIHRGGTNDPDNLRVVTRHQNRTFKRGSYKKG